MAQKIPVDEVAYGKPASSETQCTLCSELARNRKQIVYASNCTIGGLLVIGEAPGKEEDEQGEGFVGAAGCTLDRLLLAHKIARCNYGRANVCRCLPLNKNGRNRKPFVSEIANCLPYLARVIEEMKPKVILAVGGTAADALCGSEPLYKMIEERKKANDWSKDFGASRAHRLLQPALIHASYIVPMPHTSSVAWHQKSRTGEVWKDIGAKQVEIAAQLMRY